jgi:hypothetical protein
MHNSTYRSRSRRNEELTSIGPWTSVGHGQQSSLGMLDLKAFVGERLAENRFSSSAVSGLVIPSLTDNG